MCYALETLCGQAYGAGQYAKLGIFLQRAIFVLNLVSIPLALLWANLEAILLILGQESQIASKAGAYARCLIPTLFASSTSQPLAKFLQSQAVVSPLFVVYMSTLVLHVPLCWLMVFHSGMGYLGAAVANSISYWFNVFAIALYVARSRRFEKTRAPLSWRALDDLKGFFELAIPSAAMIWYAILSLNLLICIICESGESM
jgi:MATE family multidrug resistance protein